MSDPRDQDSVLGSAGYYEKSIDQLDSSQGKLVSEVQQDSTASDQNDWHEF